ncbi:MAG: hypothetical protein JST92_24790 [Deltaproteobacteria bacterium]|nr:hypothetical protein [Deltaproteobacteria bacterium]
MSGVVGPTEGACVECVKNSDCSCLVQGQPNSGACAGNPKVGSLNGARCVSDACVAGCDTDNDCPANHLCSLSGATAHTCVECTCAGKTINDTINGSAGWCDDPTGSQAIGGCGVNGSTGAQMVCDAFQLKCRAKRQDESCLSSNECGDTHDPGVGQCNPVPARCIFQTNGSTNKKCSAAGNTGRCGIACNDPSTNQCLPDPQYCPSGSHCKASQDGQAHSGSYCVSDLCTF